MSKCTILGRNGFDQNAPVFACEHTCYPHTQPHLLRFLPELHHHEVEQGPRCFFAGASLTESVSTWNGPITMNCGREFSTVTLLWRRESISAPIRVVVICSSAEAKPLGGIKEREVEEGQRERGRVGRREG